MNKNGHKDITRAALALIANNSLLKALVDNSVIGDEGNANGYSASHYDNCCWEESKQWIAEHRKNAIEAAYSYYKTGNISDYDNVCKNLGYLIHTTEDFYAHSNWVENNKWGEIADLEGPRPAYWYSGYYESSAPHKASPGVPLHDNMNKDNPARPNYFKAFGAAVFAVRVQIKRFLQDIKSIYPPQADDIIFKLGFRKAQASFIDAALYWPGNKVYFFTGSMYYRYDLSLDKVDTGYPKPIKGNWFGLEPFENHIDAAFAKPDGSKAYFFSGSKYIRYDIKKDKADDGYPLPIMGNWLGLEPFSSGIDAVFMLPQSNTAYFFKGNLYIRYDIAADRAYDGYPRQITGDWKGLEAFGSVDAAFPKVDGQGNIKIYFFKGDQYLRYQYVKYYNSDCIDWDTMYNFVRKYSLSSDSVDTGYPLPISGNWHIIKPV